MIVQFKADEAGTIVEEGFVATGVKSTGGGQYLLFQRAMPVGGADDDGVYFEFDDQINAGYDKIARCVISRERLTVDLAEAVDRAKKFLRFDVHLQIPNQQWEELLANLRLVFTGSTGILVVE